ncbi:MAG TPA: hypothetical protein VIC27_11260, partial [Ktedonobacterales bacterium]
MRQQRPTMFHDDRRRGLRGLRGLIWQPLWALLGLVALAALLAGCGVPGTIHTTSTLPPSKPTPTQAPLPPVAFPQDEAPHQDLTEWWYYTGHLAGKDAQGQSHTYGFEL